MPSAEELAHQRRLLEKHRRNLALLEQQVASFGGELAAPLYIINGLRETREAIQRIEDDMRAGRVSRSEAISTDRNRTTMLAKVRAAWIGGVLDQSLYHEVRLSLGLLHRPDKVEIPLRKQVQELHRGPVDLPAGTTITDVYDRFGGTLLILGAPGGGKTTMLLELARDLLDRADSDPLLPMPVVFNLSSWAAKRQPLETWLAEQLNTNYGVPLKLAQEWIANDHVLPLLDGLDEVVAEHRADCVIAINSYRDGHGLLPMVVCSRLQEYESVIKDTELLRLHSAIVLQSLSRAEVERYLDQVGEPLVGLRNALAADRQLWLFAVNPLTLSVLSLAYWGKTAETIGTIQDGEQRRAHIFDAYVNEMFTRRGAEVRYPQEHVFRWLEWLARRLKEDGQTIIRIEDLQPQWLPTALAQWWYRIVVSTGFGLVGGLLGWLSGTLVLGLIFGLIFGLVFGLVLGQIQPVDTMSWSWPEAMRGLVSGFVRGLIVGLIGALFFGLDDGLERRLAIGVVVGLAGGLRDGLDRGLRNGRLSERSLPNEGIHHSLRNACVSGLVGVLVGVLIDVLISVLFDGLDSVLGSGLFNRLFFGVVFGVVFALTHGGGTVVLHYSLRFLFWRYGLLPLRLIPFLNYCVDRIFLRRVGGGYIFVHRMLLEYFALLDTSQTLSGTPQQTTPPSKPTP